MHIPGTGKSQHTGVSSFGPLGSSADIVGSGSGSPVLPGTSSLLVGDKVSHNGNWLCWEIPPPEFYRLWIPELANLPMNRMSIHWKSLRPEQFQIILKSDYFHWHNQLLSEWDWNLNMNSFMVHISLSYTQTGGKLKAYFSHPHLDCDLSSEIRYVIFFLRSWVVLKTVKSLEQLRFWGLGLRRSNLCWGFAFWGRKIGKRIYWASSKKDGEQDPVLVM